MNATLDRPSLVTRYRRLASGIAHRLGRMWGATRPADLADLGQAALIGLWRASVAWDPDHPSRASFPTFARFLIRDEVQAAFRRMRGRGCDMRVEIESYSDAPQQPYTSSACAEGYVARPFEEVERLESSRFEAELQLADVLFVVDQQPLLDRACFTQHFMDGEPVLAIARDRGVTRQAIQHRLAKVRRRVREAVLA